PDALAGGRAIALDPGPHTFHLASGADSRDESIVLREGEKERRIVLRLSSGGTPPLPPPEMTRPVPASAFIAAGVGVLGLGSFTVFGLRAVNDRDTFGCGDGCASDRYDRVSTGFLIADISVGVAVVAFAVAGYLFVTRPARPAVTNAALLSF